jgi:hypothetical protein
MAGLAGAGRCGGVQGRDVGHDGVAFEGVPELRAGAAESQWMALATGPIELIISHLSIAKAATFIEYDTRIIDAAETGRGCVIAGFTIAGTSYSA